MFDVMWPVQVFSSSHPASRLRCSRFAHSLLDSRAPSTPLQTSHAIAMVLPSLFVTLLALAASPLAAIAAKSIQPPAELARARPARAINSRDSIAAERMTNAKRMSQGLPPLPPRMHRRGSPTAGEQRVEPLCCH